MQHPHVCVSFGEAGEFDLRPAMPAADAQGAEAARAWFDREFVALECDLASPVGKVLSADRVLNVAKYSGVRRFREQPQWAEEFARHAAALLGRDFIRVDVPGFSIGF